MICALEIFLFAGCLLGTVFFSACETAITSVSLTTWEALRPVNLWMERAYRLWTGDPSLVLAVLLFGNTLCSLGAGILASAFFYPASRWLHLPNGVTVALGSFVTGSFILVVGEMIPKLYAQRFQQKVLRASARSLIGLTWALAPLMRGLTALSHALKRRVSSRSPEPLMTKEELGQVLTETQSEGLAPTARKMLSNLIAFDRVKVSEVMVPRAHMVAVRMDQNNERLFTAVIRSGFSRLPVYFGNLDNIVGVLYAKDLLVEWRSSGLLVLEDLLRPVYRIAPEAPLATLLQAFRQGQHMAIVTDALGGTRGIATIEDVVETIVGDIADEFDQLTPS